MVSTRLIKRKQYRPEVVYNQKHNLQPENSPSECFEQIAEKAVLLQIGDNIARPEKDRTCHGKEIDSRVYADRCGEMMLIQDAPEYIGDIIDENGKQIGIVRPVCRDRFSSRLIVQQNIMIDDKMNDQGQKPCTGVQHAIIPFSDGRYPTLVSQSAWFIL